MVPDGVVVTRNRRVATFVPLTWIEVIDPVRYSWERHNGIMSWCGSEIGVRKADWDMAWRQGHYYWRFRTKDQAWLFRLVWC